MFTTLEFIQAFFAQLCFTSALMLVYSSSFISRKVAAYERSRWLLFAMMATLGIHYVLQIVFGFRAMGDDVGALVNIPFYSTATYLLHLSILNMTDGGRVDRLHRNVGWAACLTVWIVTSGAVILTGQWHQPKWLLFLLVGIFFFELTLCIYFQLRKFGRTEKILEANLGNPNRAFVNHMKFGAYIIYSSGIIVPVAILFYNAIVIVGLFIIPVLFLFAVNFVCLGSNVQGALEALDTDSNTGECDLSSIPAKDKTEEEKFAVIETAISRWREYRGFANSELSLASFSRQVGIPQHCLSTYINRRHGCTFRAWITHIRVEEAMKMMRDYPNYSIEAIADECGFSSRSFFQTKFKEHTGSTPKDWMKTEK